MFEPNSSKTSITAVRPAQSWTDLMQHVLEPSFTVYTLGYTCVRLKARGPNVAPKI